MKIAEIRELSTKELVERIDAEVAAYDQKVINHSISPSENPAQIKQQRRMLSSEADAALIFWLLFYQEKSNIHF